MKRTKEKDVDNANEAIVLWEKIVIPILKGIVAIVVAIIGAVSAYKGIKLQTVYPIQKEEERNMEKKKQDAILKIGGTVREKRAGINYLKYTLKVNDEDIGYRVKPYCCVTVLLENSEEMVFIINDYYTQDEYLSDKKEIALWKEDNDDSLQERIATLLQTADLKYEKMNMFTLLLVDYENCEIIPGCVFYTLSEKGLEMVEAERGQKILKNGKQYQYNSADELWVLS